MPENDPLWYKDAIIYEVPVKSFHDSIGDGMGDFPGLTQKLDYLQDLGITAIWILPFYPSPLRDDGYDIADYTEVHPQYGKLRDFKEFLAAAHARGLRVITELVINHTSDQHPWFQRARRSPPGSVERDFYVWSDTAEKYPEARIIFKDFENSNWTWDSVARAYYWHRFYSHQPDLNFDNPAVWKALMPLLDYWFGMGVDGMRLDAIPYLYEREGTNCENLPETHAFLKALRRHVDERFQGRMFLAEANQWPEDAVAYFGQGDECHMAFHFPVMPRLFMAIHMEDRFPILDILAQTPAIPENCQWCMFLRNHDELTLEMVTDEERDYMYRAYASDPRARINFGIRRRLAPLLGNNRQRIELMNGLLFSLPGTPIIYYGDEIGMGDNIYLGDRDGVRTPMQWSSDRNAGFSRTNPQKLYLPVIIDPEYHYEAINVEAQQNNPNSLLWWMKRLIALRKRFRAFGRGTLEFLQPSNRRILVFLRRYQDECILVVANLSRFVQYAELDLSRFEGVAPVELFGRTVFPRIGKLPYLLTLGPHAFYWFALQPQTTPVRQALPSAPAPAPALEHTGAWETLLEGPSRRRVEALLPDYLLARPWFTGKERPLKTVTIRDAYRLRYAAQTACVVLVDVEFHEDTRASYVLPLTFAEGDAARRLHEQAPGAVLARLEGERPGVLVDALYEPAFGQALLEAILGGRSWSIGDVDLTARPYGTTPEPTPGEDWTPWVCREDQSNTTVLYGRRLILKLFRRLEQGINPELEVGLYLHRSGFAYLPEILGSVELRFRKGEPATLAVLEPYVSNEGNAWQYTLDELSRFFEHVLALPREEPAPEPAPKRLLERARLAPPERARERIGNYLAYARLLGTRTAAMHCALAAPSDDPAFNPEPFTTLYQRSLYQSVRNLQRRVGDELAAALPELPMTERAQAQQLLGLEQRILNRIHGLLNRKIAAQRTRYHGDYHLAQLLNTGNDVVIIDFEGDPARSISDRRLKRSVLRDVASMLRSFHYAAWAAMLGKENSRGKTPGWIRPEDVAYLQPWAHFWYEWVTAAFLSAYLETAAASEFLPQAPDDLQELLDFFLIEKALLELGNELTHRLDWVAIPLTGLLQLLDSTSA